MRYHDAPLLGGVLGTDQYQLAMAQLYWREGLAERTAQFDYFFRSYPDYGTHQAGYCITAGQGWLFEWMERASFGRREIDALGSQRTGDGQPRFDPGFLDWLADHGDFSTVSVASVAEGRVVHANVPVATVQAPLAIAQILETPFLNRLNYQTLVATKASRVKEAARGSSVLEFGMRRGPEAGADAGGRGALIGGCDFSSNVALSHSLGLDPKGTNAHAMVQVYLALGEGELAAFRAFARLYPAECILLVDTIDTLGSGIPNAITVFEELRSSGYRPAGIRLDSGDLAHLSIVAARMLDEAGFEEVSIVLSSDLDELAIWQILSQIDDEAPSYGVDPLALSRRLIYGVGTRLITSEGDSALGGVYKLTAIDDEGEWAPAIKVSDTVAKIPAPGDKRMWRVYDDRGFATADVIALADEHLDDRDELELFHPHRDNSRRIDVRGLELEELQQPAFADGKRLMGDEDITSLRRRRRADLDRLDPGVRRVISPHIYHVSMTGQMKRLQRDLIRRARGD